MLDELQRAELGQHGGAVGDGGDVRGEPVFREDVHVLRVDLRGKPASGAVSQQRWSRSATGLHPTLPDVTKDSRSVVPT